MSTKNEYWRVLFHSPRDGATNMAIDEAIMRTVSEQQAPPTLRFYAWEPACLSLGYGQPFADADVQRIQSHGWHIVRRATGGRAILHTDELTYSITFPDSHPLASEGIIPTYRQLSGALLSGLQSLGVPVAANQQHQKQPSGPVCFEVPSDYEITALGRKLIGSAQVRRGNGVLQHGSLPLTGDITRICEALAFEDEAQRERAKERVLHRAVTLEEALGVSISWEQVAHTLADAFAQTFEVELQPGELSESEVARTQQLIEDTYAHPDWNQRR